MVTRRSPQNGHLAPSAFGLHRVCRPFWPCVRFLLSGHVSYPLSLWGGEAVAFKSLSRLAPPLAPENSPWFTHHKANFLQNEAGTVTRVWTLAQAYHHSIAHVCILICLHAHTFLKCAQHTFFREMAYMQQPAFFLWKTPWKRKMSVSKMLSFAG